MTSPSESDDTTPPITYTATLWKDSSNGGTPLNATHLNNLEAGIAQATNTIDDHDDRLDALEAVAANGGSGAGYITTVGTTAQRPALAPGIPYFDTTLGKSIWGNAAGTAWQDATGTALAGAGGQAGPTNFTAVTQADQSILCTWVNAAGATTSKLYESRSLTGVTGATALVGTSTSRTPGTLGNYEYWVTNQVGGVETAASNHATCSLPFGSTPSQGGGSTGGGTTLSADSIYRTTFEEMAYELTSTAENSTKDWTTAYQYIEDIGDGRGYTAGIVGFTSADGDMLLVVQAYNTLAPGNTLSSYTTSLQTLANEGEGSSAGTRANSLLGATFRTKWAAAATGDPLFRQAQRGLRESTYWLPALQQALTDHVQGLGLAILYDISVNHGPGTDSQSFGGIVATAKTHATAPTSVGGSGEAAYLTALINARQAVLVATGDAQSDGRVPMHQALVATGNLTLAAPISWTIYGDSFSMTTRPDLPADAARPNGLEPGAPATGGTVAGTPAQILNIGSGATQNHFNVGIGYSTGHVDKTMALITGGFIDNPYFTPNTTGTAVQFEVFANGGTTSSTTSHPRSELRELLADGVAKAAWTAGPGKTHVMSGTSTVTHLPADSEASGSPKPQICFAQIHDADGDVVRLQVEDDGGHSINSLLIKAHTHSPNASSSSTPEVKTTIQSTYTIGTPIDWKIEVVNTTCNLYIGGVVKFTFTISGTGFYFKAGDYQQFSTAVTNAQGNPDGGYAATSFARVELKNLAVTHTPAL